jgi:hypothetical protein
MDGVDYFQTFVDVVNHFQSLVDKRDDLYSLHRMDPFLVRHGRCGLFLVIHTLLRSFLTAWKNTNCVDHFIFPMPLDHVHRRHITSIWGRLFLVTDTWPVLVLFSIPCLKVWSVCIWKGLEVRMGAKYDGGTNAICWNVDIIANEKLTRHINFLPPLGWRRLCL